MRTRNWLVEDNLVALYLALYGDHGLRMSKGQIAGLIGHKGFQMRIQNYTAIHTNGRAGLTAGLKAPLFKELYKIGTKMDQRMFRELVTLVLDTKAKLGSKSR